MNSIVKLSKFICVLGIAAMVLGCEKVVDVDLEESAPRLVIEASLLWDDPEVPNPLFITLSHTAPYFDQQTPPVQAAQVRVLNDLGDVYEFQETQPGLYRHEGFIPDPDATYELEVQHENELYRASESFVTAPGIDAITQNYEGGFSGDEIEIEVFYTDPPGKGDQYLFKFLYGDGEISVRVSEDDLTDGNQNSASLSEDELEPGQEVYIEFQGISRSYYEYMYILISQAGQGGGPFQTQPTLVRGNIINSTNFDNFAFGFFRLSQRTATTYVIE